MHRAEPTINSRAIKPRERTKPRPVTNPATKRSREDGESETGPHEQLREKNVSETDVML